MNILYVASEASPFAKTGGLADVAGALPIALGESAQVALIIPGYATQSVADPAMQPLMSIPITLGERTIPAVIKKRELSASVTVYFVCQDLFFQRAGLYGTSVGDYFDNFFRFLFFQKAVAEFIKRSPLHFDIVHANDWQTGLVPMFIKLSANEPKYYRVATVFSIHNLGYQGLFERYLFPYLGIAEHYFSPEFIEFFAKINMLKAGVVFADRVLTVSPTYAREIQTDEFGVGLGGLLRKYSSKIGGILNGIDSAIWNPERDAYIEQRYSAQTLDHKEQNKIGMYQAYGIGQPLPEPLFVFIGRLTKQKGIDLLVRLIPELAARQSHLIVLGKGEQGYEEKLAQLSRQYKTNFTFICAFDEPLAHRLTAAGDFLLMPSLYEPCGLNQMYALQYGTIPLVAATGGLVDTVSDDAADRTGTGFVFARGNFHAFLQKIDQALALYAVKPAWRELQQRAMAQDFSWSRSAHLYLSLYQSIVR